MSNFFEDLIVVELACVLAGPAVGMFFAELGANVIKIENKTTGGDVTRTWKLSSENRNSQVSAYFSSVNYRKKYIFLDFNDASDKNILINYIQQADVLIVNFKVGDDIKFGLDYNAIKSSNPKIIYAHLTGYGPHNPKVAYDIVLQAETGFLSMNGNKNSEPVKMPVALIDVLAAHQLKEAILLALIKRNKNNCGSYIHLSLYETAISSLANQASNYLMQNHIPQPIGTLHPNIAPYGEIIYSSNNIPFVLAVGSNRQFQSLCQILNCKLIANDIDYCTNDLRVKNRIKLIEILNQNSKQLNSDYLNQEMINKNVPFGKINTLDTVFENPMAQQMIREENIDGINTKRVTSIAFNTNFLND